MAGPHDNDDLYTQDYPQPRSQLHNTHNPTKHDNSSSPTLRPNAEPTVHPTRKYSGGIPMIMPDDNDLVLIEPRSPSPPPTTPSQERRSFDRRIHQAHAERNAISDNEHEDHMTCMFRTELAWRAQQQYNAEQQQNKNQPYRILRPWCLEMREQCVGYPRMLDMYYGIEALAKLRLWERLADMRQLMTVMEVSGGEFYAELGMLLRVEEARERDKSEGNDAKVLMKVLDEVEKRLNAQIDVRFGGETREDEDEEVQELVTELPRFIFMAVLEHPEVMVRMMDLRERERDFFPSRFNVLGAWDKKASPAASDGGAKSDQDSRKRPSPTILEGSATKKIKERTEEKIVTSKTIIRQVC